MSQENNTRCGWCKTDPIYLKYHDEEWGKEVTDEFGSFCNYLRTFLPDGKPIMNHWRSLSEIPPSTPLSDAISKDMKKRGFKFFGTTICYAHLQAVGYVNDHLEECVFKYRR
jgi:DNA-3-methyladenine glycosylase I